MRIALLSTLLLVAICTAPEIAATTINVPADQPTIQAGVDAAFNGDTVLVSTGVYTGNGNRYVAIWNKTLVLTSQSGSSFTIIDPQDASIAFELVGADVEMSGLTIRNTPMAVYVEDSDLRLDNMAVSNCDEGINIQNTFTSFDQICTIRNSTIVECGTGIIACNSGYDSINVVNTSFVDNGTALFGCQGSPLIADTCFFSGNAAVAWGTLTLQNSTVSDGINGLTNDSDDPSEFTVLNTTLSNLTGTVFFSRIFGEVENCTIADCTGALAGGGTVFDDSPSLHFRNCSFYSNSGNISLLAFRPRLTFDSCYFEDYTGSIVYEGSGGFGSPVLSLSHCEFHGGGGDPLISVESWGVPISFDHNVFSDVSGEIVNVFSDSVFLANNTVVNCDSTFVHMHVTAGESYTFVRNIAANNGGPVLAITGDTLAPFTVECNDFWNNLVNTIGVPDPVGGVENFAADPLFCSDSSFGLYDVSPCAASSSPCGAGIGAEDVECEAYSGPVWHISTGGSDSLGDGSEQLPFATIQHGIDVAIDGDTVLIHTGSYSGTGNWDLTAGSKNLVITGLPDSASQTTIVCGTGPDPDHWGISLTAAQGNTTVINGLTFTDTDPLTISSDPAILLQSSDAVVRNCEFVDLGLAGAIKISGGNPLVEYCAFTNCQAGNSSAKSVGDLASWTCGGGFYTDGGAIEIVGGSTARIGNCQFNANKADDQNGGALAVSGSSPLVEDCQFNGNNASGEAGGGHASLCSGADAVFKRCTFSNGQAGFSVGGAIACDGSSPTFDSCTFTGNFAPDGGGVLHCQNAAAPVFTFCQFENNFADLTGGAFLIEGGSQPTFQNCTIKGSWAGEDADFDGQVLAANGASVATFVRCLIAFNGVTGGPVACGDPGSVPLFSCSNIYNSNDNSWIGCISDQLGINSNYSIDPDFCNGLEIAYTSYCAPEHSPCGELVGALSPNCAAPCCRGMTGNVDYDIQDAVNLTDLTKLVNYLFVTFESLPCRAEANISGDNSCDITLSDLTLLVNYLFVTFIKPATCNSFDEAACGQL